VLFEALLAITLLVLSVLTFFFLFSSGSRRSETARTQRNAVVLADNVLATLRVLSEENARANNWLGFWRGFLATNGNAHGAFNPAADAWSNLVSGTVGRLTAYPDSLPPGITANPWARDAGFIRFRFARASNDWVQGIVETNRSGWYRYHAGAESDTAQTVARYRISARFWTNGVGATDAVSVVVSAWPGAESPMTPESEVRLYAEFRESGAL
jgi:hypothetical protein